MLRGAAQIGFLHDADVYNHAYSPKQSEMDVFVVSNLRGMLCDAYIRACERKSMKRESAVSLSWLCTQVRRCMEVLGRFQYHVIGGATGSGKGKLLDTLTAQGAQVLPLLLSLIPFAYDVPLLCLWACDLLVHLRLPLWLQACCALLFCYATACMHQYSCSIDA